jgi:SAM-dependent methyltransferase
MSKAVFDPTRRFSDRVGNYIKYRPSYPPAIIDCLHEACGLTAESVIADVGSGTGLLTELFLKHGNRVYAVEPNDEMRLAAERLLSGYSNLMSVNGRAEATMLADQSVDFVTAGQAFHWFEPGPTRVEFGRILRPGGWVVLVWNTRLVDDGGLMTGYELLLDRYALDYHEINHSEQNDNLPGFFGGLFERRTFVNQQELDWEGMVGRLLSSSYAPPAGHAHYEPLLVELRQLFDDYQRDGRISFLYETELYWGRP